MEAPNVIDQDQQWLLNCLTATLDTDRDVGSFAEASLQQASLQPGFGVALSKVTVNRDIPLGLPAVLLKQFVKQHWQEDDPNYIQPVVSPAEKALIRNLLPLALDDPHGKICVAVGMAVASIAQYDWPEQWPELMPFLLKLISDQTNMNGVRGSLRCLVVLSGDLDDTVVPTLVPVLFPCLYNIVSSSHVYDKNMRRKALSIFHSCASTLGAMTGVYKTETMQLMMPMIKAWMEQFSCVLQPPMRTEDPDDWSIRMEVLKCLIQLVQNFPSLAKEEFTIILASLWKTFVSCLRVYELSAIRGTDDPYSGRVDSEGGDVSLEAFVIQLFEFLLTIVGDSKLVKVVGCNLIELVYYTIDFLQMTEEQVQTWSSDANQYVADEDDVTYSCRVSGILLLEEVVNAYEEEGIKAILEAVQKRSRESSEAKASGAADWWKLREAAIFALGSLSESFHGEQVDGVTLGFKDLLEHILTEDVQIRAHEYPFLHARAFWAVAKFSSVVGRRIHEQYLYAAMKAIASDSRSPVIIGACRALSQLLPESSPEIVQPHIMGLLSAVTELLKQASDETLHLVLETLQAAIKAGSSASSALEPILSPLILNMWVHYVSDPFISIDLVEVLEAIKNVPGCLQPLVSRILPSIAPVLENPQQQPEGLVAGSLDILTMLLKNAPVEVVKVAFEVCFNSIIKIVIQSEDHGEMQNATECLAAFVLGGKAELLSWGGDPGFTLRSLLDAASRLLDPNLDSSGSLFVGSYILQLILHMPSQMAQHIRDLVAAIVRRMESCQIAGLKSALLLVLARLVHLSAPNVGHFIDLMISLPAKGHDNALPYVMSEWTKQQGEMQGAYQIKVTTTALALLLSSQHAELAKISVQGHLIKSSAGIVTRSKAKLAPDQWTLMPLPAKILALLADVLIEIQEQVLSGDDVDSDWEELEAEGETRLDILHSVRALSNKRPTIDQLDAMKSVFNENQDDDYEDDFVKGVDPLNEINLSVYLVDFLKTFSSTNKPSFDLLCQSLTDAQRSAIHAVVK
ncbi:hypothetical protein AMTRI_Chr10g6660 [Amborella trichopoda]